MACEVWLEITDAIGEHSDSGDLHLSVRWQEKSAAGSAQCSFASPLTPHTARLVEEYVRDFRSWRAQDRDRALTAERTLLTLGRALGSGLVDPEYRLLTFCEAIERGGVATLHVVIRSDDPAVMAVPWELLILPDAAHVLAAAAAAFVRTPAACQPFEQPARELGLRGGGEEALGYLRIAGAAQTPRISNAWRQLGWQGALRYQLAPLPGLPQAPLDRGQHAWHIVHWSGELTRSDGELRVQFDAASAESALSAREFAARARALGAQLLIVEPSLGGELADELARAALQAGIDNVLMRVEASERGWPSDFADPLLEFIGAGLGLRQAVVETRKQMQRTLLEARQAEVERPHAPQQWHALRHYSARDVVFFAQAQPRVSFESAQAYQTLRERLFGFDAQWLPPNALDLGDRPALHLLRTQGERRAVLVTAPHGGGLTHALHRAALLACANGDVERAYYWDFAREAFGVHDVLEMVAGARGETDPAQVTEAGVLAQLSQRRELFVFDNVDAVRRACEPAASAEHAEARLQLAARLADAGGLCWVGTHAGVAAAELASCTLPPLSETECIALVQASAPQALGFGAGLMALLQQLQGLPLLIRRVLGPCEKDGLRQLLAEATESYGAELDRADQLRRFHALRWQQLEPHWRCLLRVWLPLEGLYLQTLMIAVDRPASEQSELGRKLWAMLGAPAGASCASAIDRLRALGFAVDAGAGVCVDRAAMGFLSEQTTPPLPEGLELLLASLLCEGLLRLLEHRNQSVADALTGHCLAHRRQLRRQIEAVLRAGQHVLGTRTFLRVHGLLMRAGLTREAGAWAGSVLEMTGPSACKHDDPVLATAWLSVALRAPRGPLSAAVEHGARYWADALARGDLSTDAHRRTLLPLVVTFLQKVYDETGDFEAYRTVTRIAADCYQAAGDTPALIPQLAALAACEHVLGNEQERDHIEQQLIDELSYGQQPAAAQLRRSTLARVARMRLRRSDDSGAEAVVQLLEREWDGDDVDALALTLRGELADQRQQWEPAAEYFCRLWKAALGGVRGVDVDAVAGSLTRLEQHLGKQRLAALYELHAGSTPTPEALGMLSSQVQAQGTASRMRAAGSSSESMTQA